MINQYIETDNEHKLYRFDQVQSESEDTNKILSNDEFQDFMKNKFAGWEWVISKDKRAKVFINHSCSVQKIEDLKEYIRSIYEGKKKE